MNESYASSVPPIFASAQGEQHEPTKPKNPDEGSKVPTRPEDTTPSGDAKNGSGEDNPQKKDS
jgi:hypothetical protein